MDERVLSREIRSGLSPEVLAAGPPPRPKLSAPWDLREMRPRTADSAVLVGWMQTPHVREFWDQAWPAARWDESLRAQWAGDYSRPYLVLRDDRPFGYLEFYRAARDVVARCCPVE